MGKVLKLVRKKDKKEDTLVFRDDEVQVMIGDDNSLVYSIPLKTVLSKLPARKGSVKFAQQSKEQIDSEYSGRLEGVKMLQSWLEMNFENNKTGKRSMKVYEKLLSELADFAERYGNAALDTAMSKCREPRQCTIPYLRAILKNSFEKEKKNYDAGITDRDNGKSGYQRTVADALAKRRRTASGM